MPVLLLDDITSVGVGISVADLVVCAVSAGSITTELVLLDRLGSLLDAVILDPEDQGPVFDIEEVEVRYSRPEELDELDDEPYGLG